MATQMMRCPFSGKACKNCPLYRSRHYSLCFNAHYQKNIDQKDEINKLIKETTLKHGFLSLGYNVGYK